MPQKHTPLFLAHGSPMNSVADNAFTRFLSAYGQALARPTAVVVISAHWQTHGTFITGSARPEQIYDFYGFPRELYAVPYAPPGAPDVAQKIASQVPGIRVDLRRGIDHAGWAVVKHLFAQADVPLLELSLDMDKSEQEHFALGKLLSNFDNDILFIGSGNVVHNLGDISPDENAVPFPWAQEADRWFKETLETRRHAELIAYKQHLFHWRRALPTSEHFLPLLYILGMQGEQQTIRNLYEEIQNGSISMRSFAVG